MEVIQIRGLRKIVMIEGIDQQIMTIISIIQSHQRGIIKKTVESITRKVAVIGETIVINLMSHLEIESSLTHIDIGIIITVVEDHAQDLYHKKTMKSNLQDHIPQTIQGSIDLQADDIIVIMINIGSTTNLIAIEVTTGITEMIEEVTNILEKSQEDTNHHPTTTIKEEEGVRVLVAAITKTTIITIHRSNRATVVLFD